MSGAQAIATGSSHSLAIHPDGTLFAWGRGHDPEPMPIFSDAVAVAAASRTTVALTGDDTLWQWDRGQKPQRVQLPDGK
jgi:alpha-tubulin suppressor-like RCC1 family protein